VSVAAGNAPAKSIKPSAINALLPTTRLNPLMFNYCRARFTLSSALNHQA
jgi:hypothetical protein